MLGAPRRGQEDEWKRDDKEKQSNDQQNSDRIKEYMRYLGEEEEAARPHSSELVPNSPIPPASSKLNRMKRTAFRFSSEIIYGA